MAELNRWISDFGSYDAIEDVKAAMEGMLAPKIREVSLGQAEVRAIFRVPKVGTVAGCYVKEGKVSRDAQARLVRDGVVIHEGPIGSLRRFKDDVREVSSGYECGIGLMNYQDVKGDIIEAPNRNSCCSLIVVGLITVWSRRCYWWGNCAWLSWERY